MENDRRPTDDPRLDIAHAVNSVVIARETPMPGDNMAKAIKILADLLAQNPDEIDVFIRTQTSKK